MHGGAVLVLLDRGRFAIGDDRVRAQPLLDRVVEDEMQLAAMDADFRERIAGELAALLPVNELAEAVVEAALAVLDAGLEQRVAEAERAELAHGMRQQRDADAQFLDLGRALVDAAGDAALRQIERERQPADTAADDGYGHAWRMDEIAQTLQHASIEP